MSSILAYPAHLEQDSPNEWALVIPDVPEAVFGASTPDRVWREAADILALALTSYPESNKPFPSPRALRKGSRMVAVPATESAKLFIQQAMAQQNMSIAELARLLKIDHKSARRIVSIRHNTKMDQLEAVLAKLGVRVALMAA